MLAAALLLLIAVACAPRGNAGPPPPEILPAATKPPASKPAAPTPAPESFRGSLSAIDAGTRARMTESWRAGCPVPLEDLRLLRLTHWGFDGRVHAGEIVVHADHARAVLGVFETLFETRFPIERMELVDVYGGDDDRSMAANNTSGFNCRRSSGDAGAWSQHAYGHAIDINPVQNPYVTESGHIEPSKGAAYVNRAKAPGVIRAGDVVVRAFAAIGWSWGGEWSSAKDYQHFSANGR